MFQVKGSGSMLMGLLGPDFANRFVPTTRPICLRDLKNTSMMIIYRSFVHTITNSWRSSDHRPDLHLSPAKRERRSIYQSYTTLHGMGNAGVPAGHVA